MALVDFILNLAGLLLWLTWRSVRFDPLAQARPKTLAGTLEKSRPRKSRRWLFLAAVGALVVVRAVFYWQLGPALGWTATLDLTLTVLPFRSDHFERILLFSALSFGRTLAVFYLALIFLAVLNRKLGDTDPFQKLARLSLGRVGRWPWPLQVLLALGMGVGAWLALQPLLARLAITPRAAESAQIFQQSLLVLAHEALLLRYLVAAFLLAHLLNSYVYLGGHAFWSFVNATGRNLLAPLRWLPLRIGRVDFAPVVAMALVFLLSELALRWLPRLNPL